MLSGKETDFQFQEYSVLHLTIHDNVIPASTLLLSMSPVMLKVLKFKQKLEIQFSFERCQNVSRHTYSTVT